MKIALSLVWLALAAGFVLLGRQMRADAERPVPALEAQSPQFEIAGEGFHIELDVAGTPLNEPFEQLREQVTEYAQAVRADVERRSRHAAIVCWVAAAASLLGLVVVWVPAGARRAS